MHTSGHTEQMAGAWEKETERERERERERELNEGIVWERTDRGMS